MLRPLLLASLLFGLLTRPAFAEDVRVYGAGEAVDPQDVASILGHSAAPKMRSLRLLDDAAAASGSAAVASNIVATAGGPKAAAPAALSLPVQFAFDSSEILPGARRQLDALAEGIRRLPALKAIVIEGHTDARGSEVYNDQLSTRRANAVKDYLVKAQGIDPGRLRPVGMGKYVPLPGLDPFAAENRRVQFRGE